MKVRVGGVWKDVDPRVKSGGSWKNVDQAWVKVGGVWKKEYARYPTVSGGTLTADANYYYMDFTASTTTQGQTTGTLVVEDHPITVDYLLVGGGGPGSQYLVANFRYYGMFYSYRAIPRASGGGAGGVVSGSTTLNPGSYVISVGSGAATPPAYPSAGKTVTTTVVGHATGGTHSYALNGSLVAYGGAAVMTTGLRGSGAGGNAGSVTNVDGYNMTIPASPGVAAGTGGTAGGANTGTAVPILIFRNNSGDNNTYVYESGGFAGGGGAGGSGATQAGVHAGAGEALQAYGDTNGRAPGVTLLGLTVGKGGGNSQGALPDSTYAPVPNSGNGGTYRQTNLDLCPGSSGVFRIRFPRSAVGG